jgi:tetratricopeptide (TPR) repeat protein
MATWSDERIREEVPVFNRAWQEQGGNALSPDVWRSIPVRAALMLHTDCARQARRDGKPPRLHETAAWSIARTLKERPAQSGFARRWYEAMAALAQGEDRWGEALDWAERGLRDFPDSARLLLVTGSIEETAGVHAAPPETREEFGLADPGTRQVRSSLLQRREVREHLEKAYQALRSAVAADPSLHEARLRLGRVAWRLGEAGEARSALNDVLSRETDGPTAFLAHLFLGQLEDDSGRPAEAVRSYEAALALDGRSQSARIALSVARLRLGDPLAARLEIEAAVGAAPRAEPDAFWLYPWGPSAGFEERLEALRREASS